MPNSQPPHQHATTIVKLITTVAHTTPILPTNPTAIPTKTRKIRKRLLTEQQDKEQRAFTHHLYQITRHIHTKIKTTYSFIPSRDLSTHMDARRVLSNMKTNEYCGTPTNLTFHNLTTNNTLPPATHHLLGLGLKYVPTPRLNIIYSQLDTSFARFDRDIGLKTFFAEAKDNNTYTNTNMRLKSTWRPPLLPSEIDSRIHRFTTSIL